MGENSMNTSCSLELLESALAGELPQEREELLHRHLRECDACATALEQMAGGEAGCREVAELLTADALDDALSARDEWSNVDFTVEHLEPADEPGVLGRLGGYDVLEIIGRGGMGIVLKAFDRELKRCVAVKVLSPHLAQSSLAKKRFAREAQAAAAVVHPNVLAIHQVHAGGRLPFLVMPLVAGESLAQRLTAQGRLELKEVLRIGMQAAAGLSAAHEQGLVHRDVKPANILLEKGVERAVLTDFGLARAADDVSMTRCGIIAGTPQYMSPEQARGEPLDGRSDLFSLGCILYEMATGVSPFRADSTLATLRRLIDDPPPAMASHDPELPPWFVGIVERLLEKEPTRRFGSAKEVSELLEGCLAHLQQPASVPLPAALPVPPLNAPLTTEPPAAAARPNSRMRRTLFKGTLAMIGSLGVALLGMFAMQATAPPDIAGTWQGEDWGQITLKQTAPGEYTGTYSDTVVKEKGPGKIDLKWSRIERRFNGAWREGDDDRFGRLSVHFVGKEIRGGLTTDEKSKINPATPALAEFVWTRVEGRAEANLPAGVKIDNGPNGPWTATLTNSEQGNVATVQLVDVGGDGHWWFPYGSLTEESPRGEYEEHGVQTYPKTGLRRTFFLRVYNRMAEPCGLNYDVTPRSELAGPTMLGLRAIPNAPIPLGFAAWVPETARTVTVRVGISAGPWEDFASAKYDETGQKQSSSPGRVGDLGGEIQALDVGLTAARGETPKHAVHVVVQRGRASLPSEDVRVIGLRRDGSVVEAEMQFQASGNGMELTAVFADASLKQFKEIKRQRRPYQWIEFRDVAMQLGRGTFPPREMPLHESAGNLHDIILAIHSYSSKYGNSLPPASFGQGYDRQTREYFHGRPYLSWRVLLLPFMGKEELFEKFHLDEPWDSEHNRKLIALIPKIYRAAGSKAADGKTNYLGICGADAVFPKQGAVGAMAVVKGTSHTMMLAEVSDNVAVEWTRPDDFPMDAKEPLKKLVGLREGGFLCAFADAAPHFISADIPEKALRFLMSRSERETLETQDAWNRWGHFVEPAAEHGAEKVSATVLYGTAAGTSPTKPPPDIAGKWQGKDWGQVVLTQTAPGQYTGTYTDTVGKEKEPGKIDLKWSRIERRFNGAWREGDDRFGDLFVRLVDNEIRGALTIDPKSKINPATPRLADLVWRRTDERAGNVLKPVPSPGGANAPTAMDLLRGVPKVRKCNVPLVATLVIKDSTIFSNRQNTRNSVDCLVECSGRDRRFEQLPSESAPWASVTLNSGDRIYVHDTIRSKTVHVYYHDTRARSEVRSFDPRILGLIEIKALAGDTTVEECLRNAFTDNVKLMGEEAINGIRAWHVKTGVGGTTEENSYWITSPSYQVLRQTRQLSKASVDIRSEYDEKDPSYPLPKRVTINRLQTVPDVSFESKQEITLTCVEWPKSIPAERFTLKSMNLPKNTVIERGSDGRVLGYWSGEQIVEEPIPEAEKYAPVPPKTPSPPPQQTKPPASKPEERESK
jgi:serine/threonine-protein kinase